MTPYILYSDGNGQIFEDTSLYVVGRSGWDAMPIPEEDWIELPDGGNLYELPGRRGIGIDVKTGDMRLCEKGWAVAVSSYHLRIPAFTWLLTKHWMMHLPCPCSAIRQRPGMTISFTCRLCALNAI